LRELLPRTDVVHLHGVWDRVLVAAAAAARRAGKPYVVMPHGMLDPWCLRQGRLKKRLAIAIVYHRMLARASFLHLLNADEQTGIAPLRLRTPTEVIPNGLFIEEFQSPPPPGTFHAKFSRLAGRPYILFLSRLHYKKGLDYLVEAFAQVATKFPEVQLVVAGPDDGYRATLEGLIAQHALNDRAHVVGPLYGRDKLAALFDAAVFCLPSRQEGFSIAITEALAASCPVVISTECHFPEVAEVGAGRITSLDAPSVAAGLSEILSEPALAMAMGSAGRALVESRFTWGTVAHRVLTAYRRHGVQSHP
ncbi:MAG: glycosyltransferase, partial [Phycisphaerales bacterium]|nr:glycosyltransferase [Phycisphaerales bacterium]